MEDAENPGMLHTSLDAFTRNKTGQDVKLSIDGKTLASDFGGVLALVTKICVGLKVHQH